MDDADDQRGLADRLNRVCYEIIPVDGDKDSFDPIPPGATVAITCSPQKGVDDTLDLARQLAPRDFRLIPHIAARMVADELHLKGILEQLQELEIDRMFVIAGDADRAAGKYESSLQLLRAMAEIDHGVKEIGIAAYPEGHPLIDDETLETYLRRKHTYASYMVTQMCLDPDVIVSWLRNVRELGVTIPVKIGIPGVARRAKLLKTALRIGVGQSARFLKAHRRWVGKMVRARAYTPDDVVAGLGPHVNDPKLGIAAFHVYTFNQIESTEHWRAEMLARLEDRITPATG